MCIFVITQEIHEKLTCGHALKIIQDIKMYQEIKKINKGKQYNMLF